MALLVDSTSPSPRSLPRCLSSCTAGGGGHWSAHSSRGSLCPWGPSSAPARWPDRSPVSAPSPASRSRGAVRSENRPRHLSLIHSTTVHTRTAQGQGRRGPPLRKPMVQRGSRGGVRRALMGYGRRQSQEGFPEEAAMKLKEQKDRDGHPGREGGMHQGRGPEQRCCCKGLSRQPEIRAGQAPGQGTSVPGEGEGGTQTSEGPRPLRGGEGLGWDTNLGVSGDVRAGWMGDGVGGGGVQHEAGRLGRWEQLSLWEPRREKRVYFNTP